MSKQILLIGNFAPHYRSAIFRQMDSELSCDFVFGDRIADIKKMDYSLLHHKVTEVHNVQFRYGYYQIGVPKLIWSNYDTYILTGDTRCISTWLFLLYALFFKNKRVFLWSHGWLGNENKGSRIISKFFYNLATGVFVYNQRSRQLMIDGGLSGQKLTTIYNSLDYDRQLSIRNRVTVSSIYSKHFLNKRKTIVFIGRLTPIKRLDLLIEAVKIMHENNKVFNVVLIGDGTDKTKLENKVVELGLTNCVWFYGASYDEEENAELLYNADLCVSPGNIGLTAIHSLMFGCPCVTNDDYNNQMPEFEAIREGSTGCFFKANNPKSLADTIISWFDQHEHDRDEIRNNCFEEVDKKWNLHFQMNIMKAVLMKK